MLCDICMINEATVHRLSLSDGKKVETHFCASCAQSAAGEDTIGDFISRLFGSNEAEHLHCACSMTYDEFEKSGRLGCEQCYRTFSSQLMPLISRVHGAQQHTGRIPLSIPVAGAEIPSEMANLRAELSRAVAEENFELAAQLRDKIKTLREGKDHE